MELSQEQIDEIKARDDRFRAVDTALQLASELTKGRGLDIFVEALSSDAIRAMELFAETSPSDLEEIMKLQVVVRTYIRSRDIFNAVLAVGRNAEADLRANDMEDSE
jgi:hypothetical protein